MRECLVMLMSADWALVEKVGIYVLEILCQRVLDE